MSTAITYQRYGSPEVLEVTSVDSPIPADGQIAIEVRATGLNLIDLKLRRGELAHVFTPTFPVTPGLEAAGVVTAIGSGVSNVTVGDEVFGVAAASGYATDVVLASWVKKPQAIDWALAAGLSIVGETAFRTLGHLALKPGETVLIHGAGGSVGSLATQLAVKDGVNVVGTASAADQEFVRSLGAVPVLYGEGWADRVRAAAPAGVDAVLDASGAGVLPDSIALAGGTDRVLTIADEAAFTLGVRFTGNDPTDRDRSALAKLAALFASEELSLRTEQPQPLADAAAVHAAIEAGGLRHKVVLIP